MSAVTDPLCCRESVHSRFITQNTVVRFSNNFPSDLNTASNDIDSLTHLFNDHCSTLLDKLAPLKVRSKLVCNNIPWLSDDIRCLRRNCCKSERLWKSSGLEVHRLHLKDHMKSYNDLVRETRKAYFAKLISGSKGNPRILFDTIKRLVSPPASSVPCFSIDDCNKFLTFFIDKIAAIRSSITTGNGSHSPTPPPFGSFGLM